MGDSQGLPFMFGQGLPTGFKTLLFICGTAAFLGVSVPVTQAETPKILINELMWMGSSASNSDEWIELRNTTTDSISLSGWRITKKSSSGETDMIALPSGTSIAPGAFFVIANYAGDASQSTLGITPDLVESDVSLVNSSLQLKLYDQTSTLIDIADDGNGQPLAGHYVSGSKWQSMERNWDYGDGSLATSWHTADISYHFDEGAPEKGTPGWQNTDPNYPPVASIVAGSELALVGESILFDAGDSSDPDGDQLHFHWNFGDGSESTQAAVSHSYLTPGNYSVVLTLSDGIHESIETSEIEIQARPTPPAASSTTIRVSELLPNPLGDDAENEFIELYNFGGQEIDLSGWKLSDGSRTYSLTDSAEPLAANGYRALYRAETGISLNNSGSETITLSAPDGTRIDEVSYYGTVAEALSWNRFETEWQWSESVTPSLANTLSSETHNDDATETKEIEDESLEANSFSPDFSSSLMFTEILPNPDGSDATDEYIELWNGGTEETNLRGWKLTDTKSYYTFSDDLMLMAGAYALLKRPQTHLNLNNDADQLFLIDPAEKIIAGVSYAKAPTGASWSRNGTTEQWSWSLTVTPGEDNEILLAESTETPAETEETEAILRSVAESWAEATRTPVSLRLSVIVAPGVLGANIFYAFDGSGGIQISSSVYDFPDLQPGDQIELSGKVGEAAGERKINLSRDDTLIVVGHAALEAHPLENLDQLDGLHGKLVRVTGTITSKRSRSLDLDVAGSTLTVTAKTGTDISIKEFSSGEMVTVTGVLLTHGESPSLLPRSAEDISRPEVLGASTTEPSAAPTSSRITTASDHRLLYAATGLAGTGIGYAIWRYRRFRANSHEIPLSQ